MAPRLDQSTIQSLITDTRGRNKKLIDEEDDLLGGNEGKRRANSSVIGGLFNLLSRPSRASSGFANALTDDDEETTPLGGLLQGLQGKGEASYSDVLGNLGVENRLAKSVGGFAGDILLDPLTYVGVKNIKGSSGAEARLRAVKELSELGSEITDETVEGVTRKLQAADPSKSFVTFAGKRISPEFEAPARVGRGVKESLIGPEDDRRLLAKALSRDSELPLGLAKEERILESANAGIYKEHQKAYRGFFDRLTRAEQEDVSRAIESGTDLSDVPVYNKARTGEFTSLEDYKKVAKNEFDRMYKEEQELGLYKPEQYNPNYVFKYYKKGLRKSMPGLPAGATKRSTGNTGVTQELNNLLKTENPKTVLDLAGKRAKDYTLDQARDANLDPAMEIGEMLELRAAKHYRTMGRQTFAKDAIQKFGVKITDKNRKFLLDNDWVRAGDDINAPIAGSKDVAEMWVPKPIAETLNSTELILKDGQMGAEFVRWYDKAIGAWKSANTAWNLGYHVRNSMSDGIINYMDGVTNPTLYSRAWTTLRQAKKIDAEEVLGVTEPLEAVGKKIKIGDSQLTPAEVWDYYLKGGSKTGFVTTEITPSLNPLATKGVARAVHRSKTVLGDVNQGINAVSENREDFFRLSHHIKGMEDELKVRGVKGQATREQLEAASLKAGERVRKYNIDYGQLSSFERNTMRRIIPFYGWMRRNLPLQVELLFTKPGYMAAYPKSQDLIQGLLGSDDGEGDFLIPKWIRDSAPVRMALADNDKNTAFGKLMKKLAGAKEGESVFTNLASSQTPMGDLETLIDPIANAVEQGPAAAVSGQGSITHKLANMVTPAIKLPGELATGTSWFTGQKLDEMPGGWGGYAASQIGPSRAVSKGLAQGQDQAITSWLLGLGLQPVTPQRQASEYRRREDVIDQRVREEKGKAAEERGLEPTARLMQRISSDEVRRLQRYKKNNAKILGLLTPEEQ